MKIEKTHYVIMKIGNIDVGCKTEYLNYDSEKGYVFTDDILMATKYANRMVARYEKFEFENKKNNGNESFLEIIPVKCTYEW